MKPMIPNKLKFDLNLNDLPTRVTQVTSEALGLISGNRQGCFEYNTFQKNLRNPETHCMEYCSLNGGIYCKATKTYTYWWCWCDTFDYSY